MSRPITISLMALFAAPQFAIGQAEKMLEERAELDRSVWAPEVEAQRYEALITRFWDRLRTENALEVLQSLKLSEISSRKLGAFQNLELGIRTATLGDKELTLSPEDWKKFLDSWKKQGLMIHATEWHHEGLRREKENAPAISEIRFLVQATTRSPKARWLLTGSLDCEWSGPLDTKSEPKFRVTVRELEVARKAGPASFKEAWTFEASKRTPNMLPLIVHDLNNDGLPDIVMGNQNLVAWNKGQMRFQLRPFLGRPMPAFDCGILADFTGDGNADYITCARADGVPRLFVGNAKTEFPNMAVPCAKLKAHAPSAFAAGDVDGDGDIDLWLSQYKLPYTNGNMPEPYYDAKDGFPSFLLINKGNGTFEEQTEARGFHSRPRRRCYSASFIDLDGDLDLDLLTSNDFAGVECFLNDGKGHFTEATEKLFYDRHLFGMSHCLADLNGDANLDVLAIGMSSTTARRLTKLGLSRPGYDKHNAMRDRMAYGNRSYIWDKDRYVRPAFSDKLARTGWSWGASVVDFDLDGDNDVFVANGHVSGKSSKDYCSNFWRHDIYPQKIKAPAARMKVFEQILGDLQAGHISWNGHETNALLLNQNGKDFHRADFLLGLGHPYDSRSILSDDFDADGKPDLLIAEYIPARKADPPRYRLHLYQNKLTTVGRGLQVCVRDGSINGFRPGVSITLETSAGIQRSVLTTGESFAAQRRCATFFGMKRGAKPLSVTVTDLYGNSVRQELKGDEKVVTLKLPFMHPPRKSTIKDDHPE